MTADQLATWLLAHGAVFAVSHLRPDGTHFLQWSKRPIDVCYQAAVSATADLLTPQ